MGKQEWYGTRVIMYIYIGAEDIISPLGTNASENFSALDNNISGINKIENRGINRNSFFLSAFDKKDNYTYDLLLENCLKAMSKNISAVDYKSRETLLILSTTKGNINGGLIDTIGKSVAQLQKVFSFRNTPLVVSNACASGVIAINTGANLIRAGLYDHVIVIGCDIISDFILNGFQSLLAISENCCSPFDKDRSGINLGEGCAAVVLSNDKTIFNEKPMRFIEGTSSNDANHISGPSRTGEGLYRTVKKTLDLCGMSELDIDFISAHGTATSYNDDMESIAFDRLNMQHIPLNSFKGYFGHTLGAAGVLETAMCIQAMRNNTLIKSLGFKNHGTVKKLNVITENESRQIETVLKTSSGFGGGNGSLILKKT